MLASSKENIWGRTPQLGAEATAPQSVIKRGEIRPACAAMKSSRICGRDDDGESHDQPSESRTR